MIFPFGLRYAYLKPVYATGAILFVCIALYVLAWFRIVHIDLERWGLMHASGQPERLVSHALLHGNLLHLALNMLTFIVFGQIVNAAVGSGLFLLSCGVAGFGSAALELALDERLAIIPGVGLSGVLAGLVTIGCLWLPKVRIRFAVWVIFMFGFVEFYAWSVGATWLLSDLFMVITGHGGTSGTAHWAHIGGFAGGVLCFAIMKVFRVAELTGFLVEPLAEKSRRRWIRKLRLLKTSAPGASEDAYRIRFCLRCGDEQFLTDYAEGKPMKCLKCGQASATVRPRDDAELKKRRRQCALVLAAPAVALFLLSWLLMQPSEHLNDADESRARIHSESILNPGGVVSASSPDSSFQIPDSYPQSLREHAEPQQRGMIRRQHHEMFLAGRNQVVLGG